MTCRPLTLAALLVVSVALNVNPASAASSTIGDPGTQEGTPGEPITLPAGRSPPPPAPHADHTITAPAPDKASLYDAYATLTHTPDGKTTIVAASTALRAAIDEEFASDASL